MAGKICALCLLAFSCPQDCEPEDDEECKRFTPPDEELEAWLDYVLELERWRYEHQRYIAKLNGWED